MNRCKSHSRNCGPRESDSASRVLSSRNSVPEQTAISVSPRLAPSLCISYSTKSDIHGIIMNPS